MGYSTIWVSGGQLDTLDPLPRIIRDPVPASATVLAALGPRKLELARDRTAGAIPILVTPEYTASARAVLGPDAVLIIGQLIVLDRDPAVARETARGPLRFLSGIGGYPQNFRRMGFSESEVTDLGDRLVDGLVAWGGVEDVATRVAEHLAAAGADQVILTVLPTDAEQVALETWSALVDRLIA